MPDSQSSVVNEIDSVQQSKAETALEKEETDKLVEPEIQDTWAVGSLINDKLSVVKPKIPLSYKGKSTYNNCCIIIVSYVFLLIVLGFGTN